LASSLQPKTKNKGITIHQASPPSSSEKTVRVPLKNIEGDAAYAATMYIGSAGHQANLIFDTGSEFLAVTSNFCDDSTAGAFNFKKFNPASKQYEVR